MFTESGMCEISSFEYHLFITSMHFLLGCHASKFTGVLRHILYESHMSYAHCIAIIPVCVLSFNSMVFFVM